MAMANYKSEAEHIALRSKVLLASAKLFLEKGYSDSSLRDIAQAAGVNTSAVKREFQFKENILCGLVSFVLTGQFKAAGEFLEGKTDDPVLYYAAETTLQLYMAESNEAVRNLYSVAYSLPRSSELIRQTVTEKLVSRIFKENLPDDDIEEFYLREISSGGIIRGHMMLPCSDRFPMEKKIKSFLEASLRIYQAPERKIKEAVEFVKQFDYPTLAKKTIDAMFSQLEHATS